MAFKNQTNRGTFPKYCIRQIIENELNAIQSKHLINQIPLVCDISLSTFYDWMKIRANSKKAIPADKLILIQKMINHAISPKSISVDDLYHPQALEFIEESAARYKGHKSTDFLTSKYGLTR